MTCWRPWDKKIYTFVLQTLLLLLLIDNNILEWPSGCWCDATNESCLLRGERFQFRIIAQCTYWRTWLAVAHTTAQIAYSSQRLEGFQTWGYHIVKIESWAHKIHMESFVKWSFPHYKTLRNAKRYCTPRCPSVLSLKFNNSPSNRHKTCIQANCTLATL